VLCGAACHVDSALLPKPFYGECKLQELLLAHPPLRLQWLQFLVASFPEKSKELLIYCLIKDCISKCFVFEGGPIIRQVIRTHWRRHNFTTFLVIRAGIFRNMLRLAAVAIGGSDIRRKNLIAIYFLSIVSSRIVLPKSWYCTEVPLMGQGGMSKTK